MNARWLLAPLLAATFLLPAPAAPQDGVESAQRALQQGLRAGDRDATADAVAELATLGGADAAEAITRIIPRIPGDQADNLYWVLVHGLANFSDPEGVEAIRAFVEDQERSPIARDVMFALTQNPSPPAVPVHEWILEEGPSDLKTMAVDALADIRAPASVDALIAALEAEEDRPGLLHERILRALTNLTGQSFGDSVNWIGWWERNRDDGLPPAGSSGGGTRSRSIDEGEIEDLTELSEERILVLTGRPPSDGYGEAKDHIEDVLARFDIPHTVVEKAELDAPDFSLDGVMMVIVNCIHWRPLCVCPDCEPGGAQGVRAQGCVCSRDQPHHENRDYRMGDRALERLEEFVADGGYLFTEDWALEDTVERIWPDLVTSGPMLPEIRVPVQPARGMTSHPYMRRIFSGSSGGTDPSGEGTVVRGGDITGEVSREWQIDAQSPAIHIESPRDVARLMSSEELREELPDDAQDDDALAIMFASGRGTAGSIPRGEQGGDGDSDGTVSRRDREIAREIPGGGRVLHILSHFGKQGSAEDEYALQNLLLNFVNEAHTRWRAAGGPQ